MRVENSLTFMVGSLHFSKSLISQTLHIPGCTDPLAVTEKCLAHRAQRQGCDMVEDNVQKHLKFEADTLKNSQVLLKQTSMQASIVIQKENPHVGSFVCLHSNVYCMCVYYIGPRRTAPTAEGQACNRIGPERQGSCHGH